MQCSSSYFSIGLLYSNVYRTTYELFTYESLKMRSNEAVCVCVCVCARFGVTWPPPAYVATMWVIFIGQLVSGASQNRFIPLADSWADSFPISYTRWGLTETLFELSIFQSRTLELIDLSSFTSYRNSNFERAGGSKSGIPLYRQILRDYVQVAYAWLCKLHRTVQNLNK